MGAVPYASCSDLLLTPHSRPVHLLQPFAQTLGAPNLPQRKAGDEDRSIRLLAETPARGHASTVEEGKTPFST